MNDMTTLPEFTIEPHPAPVSAADRGKLMEALGFGKVFTDHMVLVRWSPDKGWHDAKVTARRPLEIDPASAVLHYAQEIFEGLKAYKAADGRVLLFRPEQNAQRFNQSASRMAMPEVPEALFIKAIEALVQTDRAWIPSGDASLYLRPFMFANEAFLGVRPANEYIFCVIASPVGAYFKGGSKAVSLWVETHYTRAATGGTGAAKCGGNYAGSLVAQAVAARHGCDQVVFLDAAEHKWIEELGGMNVFFVMDDNTLVTPPLGTILPGITRKSIMTIAAERGLKVIERLYSFAEWQQDATSGRLKEAFACGTAAVLAGIGKVRHADGEFAIGDGETGPLTQSIREELVKIQTGQTNDGHGWVREVRV
nr:branched-chain amino acid aminotransferase [uncultured Gellertiella sp.]